MKYNRIQEIENYIKNAKVASLDELLNQGLTDTLVIC